MVCFKISTKIIYIQTLQEEVPSPTPDSPAAVLSSPSLHSVLVEGTQHVGKVPPQCQRQSVQHNERCEWIEQDHCLFQKRQCWNRNRRGVADEHAQRKALQHPGPKKEHTA